VNVVAMVAIGELYQKLAEITRPRVERYASRIGAAFTCLSKPSFSDGRHPVWEKLRLRDLLKDYDRVAFIDTDCLVRETCPDLFAVVKKGRFGAVEEASRGFLTGGQYRAHVESYLKLVRGIPWYPGWYINTGVLVFDRAHAEILQDPPIWLNHHLAEQNWINATLAWKRPTVEFMPPELNWFHYGHPDAAKAHIIHYVGSWDKKLENLQAASRRWP